MILQDKTSRNTFFNSAFLEDNKFLWITFSKQNMKFQDKCSNTPAYSHEFLSRIFSILEALLANKLQKASCPHVMDSVLSTGMLVDCFSISLNDLLE